jgi:hypothetical protein
MKIHGNKIFETLIASTLPESAINRNAVVADAARDGRMGMAATALRLEMICGR